MNNTEAAHDTFVLNYYKLFTIHCSFFIEALAAPLLRHIANILRFRRTPVSHHTLKYSIAGAGSAPGAGGGGRTRTVSLPPDFESGTSANSITPA